MKDRLLSLLGVGVSPAQAAAAVGCTPGYVSQLLATDDFALEVSKLRVEALTAATDRDRKYDSLEDELLAKLKELLPFMMRPGEVVKALATINAAKRRGAGAAEANATTINNIVVLQLPDVVKQRFVTNQNSEVVEVDGRTLLTIDSNTLLQQVKGAQNGNNSKLALASAEI